MYLYANVCQNYNHSIFSVASWGRTNLLHFVRAILGTQGTSEIWDIADKGF